MDRKSLDNLDRGLAQKLEFKCSIPLAKLRNKNLEPAMEEVKASGVRMVWVIQASTGFPDPSNVAIVTPAKKGPPPDCRSDSTSSWSDTGRRGSPSRPQENSNDRCQGALVGELTPLRSQGRPDVRRRKGMGPRGRREDSTPRARKRDRSGSQATVEPRRLCRYDDITTSPRKTHGVERENAVVPPTQTHKGLPTRSWLKASGTPKDRVVGFLSEDPTRTYDALAEIKK